MSKPDTRAIEFNNGSTKLVPTGEVRPPRLGEWYWHTKLEGPRKIIFVDPEGQPQFDAIILKEVEP